MQIIKKARENYQRQSTEHLYSQIWYPEINVITGINSWGALDRAPHQACFPDKSQLLWDCLIPLLSLGLSSSPIYLLDFSDCQTLLSWFFCLFACYDLLWISVFLHCELYWPLSVINTGDNQRVFPLKHLYNPSEMLWGHQVQQWDKRLQVSPRGRGGQGWSLS